MTENVLLRVCRAQASLAETLIEPWMRDHDAPGRAHMIEALLPRLLGLCSALAELHTATWQDLFAGGVREIQNVGEDLQRLWADALAFLGGVRDNGRECLTRGYPIDHFDELERAVEALGGAAAEHAARWPWTDQETLARARADVAAGRCHKAREVLDALRNPVR
ncbi:MAG TPA: hypothetical protein VEL76_17745 [Gemmataceae bacterium]|nr:hypothetical protein [Gemmataceae bacterium]